MQQYKVAKSSDLRQLEKLCPDKQNSQNLSLKTGVSEFFLMASSTEVSVIPFSFSVSTN